MVSILFAYSEEAKQRAIEKGYREQKCLVKIEPGSEKKVKSELEREAMREIRPFQVIVGDYWGATMD